MKVRNNIPNFITLLNLLCGCLAVILALEGKIDTAGILILIAAILDFLDGFVARMLKASSDMGKELDSLADVVSFGLAPGLIFFQLIEQQQVEYNMLTWEYHTESYLALIIVLFSAIRLAKFNIDTRQSESFIGVPTPANALFIAFLPEWTNVNSVFYPIVSNQVFLLLFPFLSAFLLVCNLRLFSLKFKSFGFKGNEIRFLFLILCIVLLAVFQLAAIPLCIIVYILLSIISVYFPAQQKL